MWGESSDQKVHDRQIQGEADSSTAKEVETYKAAVYGTALLSRRLKRKPRHKISVTGHWCTEERIEVGVLSEEESATIEDFCVNQLENPRGGANIYCKNRHRSLIRLGSLLSLHSKLEAVNK
jgi:hypothetical protein